MRSRLLAAATFLLASCAPLPPGVQRAAPDTIAAPRTPGFVVAANPLAVDAGMAVLRRGGSAVDAAIAVQAMLSLVEPQSSGIGGGAFMTYYDAGLRDVTVYDGREVAPAGATPDMFLDPATGQPLPFAQAVLSGRATGVPGAVAMLAEAHRRHGALAWNVLFDDAQRTARDGFVVSPRLAHMLQGSYAELSAPDVQHYFARAGGGLLQAGDRLRNPAYADFLTRLAAQGPAALYRGETARRIVARVRAAPLPGSLSEADLAAYAPVARAPVCGAWRVYRVCAAPPPASGVGLIELLGLLERTDIAKRAPNDPQGWYLFAEASRLMYADRDRYVADPAFVRVPVAGMIEPAYLDARARLIGPRAGPAPVAGTPRGAPAAAPDATREPAGTSHFIVGDGAGNVVSMTTTVESIFGSGRMVDGFFLNNQMTDFSFAPRNVDGRVAVNAVAPGKRPRSSMTPLVLLDREGRFAGAIGSAGGNAILAYVAKSLVAAVDWNLPTQQALAQPNLVARGDAFQGEVTKFSPPVLAGLAARGVALKPGQGEDSGVHAMIVRAGNRYDGGYDPRREGKVVVEAVPAPRIRGSVARPDRTRPDRVRDTREPVAAQ
ncbi:gamma-glutamyltransferase family protein [Sphingomonas sp. RHCKR47]|uniref:gamma-glutamyltransferase family protein n=1 Tax=Sphingomonas citricola TaxID=2862498 RepID=UPI001C67680B|nr:gamma-glutamyltransferase family protein [Sphingomonas citricola]MBW6522604.1 gamma-glutamyltransferase family protein [Sphingomonas citricola]